MVAKAVGFRGRVVSLQFNPRIGVCNACRAIVGEVDAQRNRIRYLAYHLHHEVYDPDDVLAYTIELCPPCHGWYNEEAGTTRPPKDPTKVESKNIKVTEECHRRLKDYLYHQRPNWSDINEVGDVVEVILDEWEEKSTKRHG